MGGRLAAVRRSVAYLTGGLAVYVLLGALAVGIAFAPQLALFALTTKRELTGVTEVSVSFVGPGWQPPLRLYAAVVGAVLVPAVVAGLALARSAGRWELRAAGRLLERRAAEPGALPWRQPLLLARTFVTDGYTWRAFRWLCVKLTAALALAAAAVLPLVPVFDVVAGALSAFAETSVTGSFFVDGTYLVDDGYFWGAPGRVALLMVAELAFAGAYLVFCTPALARLQARLSWRLLTSRVSELEERVGELAETRAGAVDAHTAELRRVERRLTDDPAAVGTLLEEARTGTEQAMGGLRDVLRTMYPPVLADRGLRGALLGLAGRCATATTVDMPADVDVPAPVEAAAYFVVAEALTNVTKHSAASHADVTVRQEPASLLVEVTDNGLGGADEDRGTGIVGMRRRVAALDGWLEVTSPSGGPAVVVAEVPCAS